MMINKELKRIVLLIFIFCSALAIGAEEMKLIISSLQFPPITDTRLENNGFSTELFSAIFSSFGYEVETQVYPWARAFELSKIGKPVMGIFPSIYNQEREQWFYYSDVIISSAYVLITRRDTGIRTYENLSEFSDKTIGILRGGITGSEIDGPGFRKEEAKDFETNIRKLLAGRFELITGEYMSITNNIRENFPEEKDSLMIVDPPISTVRFHLMISKSAPDASRLLRQCNEGIAKIKEDGTLERLLEKYGIRSFTEIN